MERTIPAPWHELSAWERDVLVTIALEGPQTGYAISESIAPTTHRSQAVTPLKKLREKGYVEREQDETNDSAYINSLTTEGLSLVHESIVQPAIQIDQNG